MMQRFAHKNMRPWLFWVLAVGLVAARIVLALCQRVYLDPQGSGLDDMLMIRAAMSLTKGNWLGSYGSVAIAKNMGFAFYLAALHALRVPVLLANGALWAAACVFAVRALRPLLPGSLSRLVVLGALLFFPVSFAAFTMRVYRDGIFMAVSLLFFAGILGLGLRIWQKRLRGSVLCATVAGLGFAAAWLLREDGVVLLAYAVCALAVVAFYLLFKKGVPKRAGKLVCVALPFALLLAGIGAVSAGNAAHYGVFMVSDLTSGAFPAAYGSLVAVSEAESGFVRYTPVTKEALQKLYAEVPTVAELEPYLVEGSVVHNGYANHERGEYGGSFYYGLRIAAQYAGKLQNGESAQQYWRQMEEEVQAAVAEGRLQSAKPAATTVPRWNGALLAPTAAETGRGILHLLTFRECDPRPMESVGEEQYVQPVAQYLHSRTQTGYAAGTSDPYYNPLQKLAFLGCDVITWVYRIAIWPLLALALVQLGRTLAFGVKNFIRKKRGGTGLLVGLLLLGLLLSFLVRMVVAGYMEAASFAIGTYLMYLAGGAPALLLFCVGAALWPPHGHLPKEGEMPR